MLETSESSNGTGFGKCGNCQIPFQKRCSKVNQIIVDGSNDESQKDIISIYEALSVIFEITPLTPNEAIESEEESSRVLTKKEIFKRGSKFVTASENANEASTSSGPTSDKSSYEICINCSEILKALYKNFQYFTKVCKLESDIGKILKNLQETSSSANQEANNTSDSTFYEVITVKTETIECEEGEESSNEEEAENDDQSEGQISGSQETIEEQFETLVPKLSPQAPESDNDDVVDMPGPCSSGEGVSENDGCEEQNMPPPLLPKDGEPRRHLRARRAIRQIIESEDEDVPHTRDDECFVPKPKKTVGGPQRVSIKVANGRGIITQLKCPKCNKQFLHENTLICHRRIIHRENIKMSPPPPLPQIKLTKQGNAERLTALADSNGKTSACPICRLEVPRTGIRHHLSTHTRSISKPWLCTICGKNFNNQASLNDHARSHIYGIPCKRCGKKIPTLEMLNHIRRCIAKPGQTLDFSCKVCHKMFQTTDQLIQHRAKVHGHFWKCKLCGIKFRQREQMQKHMNTHKQKKSHKCKICDKSFDRIDVLRLHIKRFHRNNEGPPSVQRSVALETGDDDFDESFPDHDSSPVPSPPRTTDETQVDSSQSSVKGSSVVTARKSSVDFTTPTNENRFVCKGCTKTFPKANELDAHLLEAHTEEETLMCKICNRKLQDSYCLKLHVKTHGETKPLECFYPNCGKIYRDKNTFFYHLKEKHGMDTKSIITKYPYVFRQKNKDYSSRYVRKRIGQMPSVPKRGKFPCEICGRIFTQIYGLRNHVKLVHEKVKDYLCKYCGKAFARKSYFMLHEKLHTSNEAPYKCHLCNKGFRLPGNLRMHLQSTIHNPNRDFVCDICGKGFNRNDNLRLHVKTVHMKIPIRKSKSEASDRYAHGGRNRIYIGSGSDADKLNNTSNPGSASFGTSSLDPVPGTSHSFFSQQNQQFPSAFQRHSSMVSHVDSSSMDSSSYFSGEGNPKRSPVQEDHHRTHQHHVPLSKPSLHLHPQDGRGNADSGQQQFPQSEYNVRGFQYRL